MDPGRAAAPSPAVRSTGPSAGTSAGPSPVAPDGSTVPTGSAGDPVTPAPATGQLPDAGTATSLTTAPSAAATPTAVPGLQPPLRPPAHQVSPKAVLWWRLRALPLLAVLVVPQVVVMILVDSGATGWLIATAIATVVLVAAYAVFVPPLLFRIHRWEVTEEAVYTLSGWLVREWRIAPISRVQTVDTAHGPLQQLLGLATVTVTTASARGPVNIAGLAADDATALARTLTETTQATPGDAT
jgi:membrane protein YdbS with pleckstrin-like domain